MRDWFAVDKCMATNEQALLEWFEIVKHIELWLIDFFVAENREIDEKNQIG
jgi:hypothetical protein